MIRCVLLALSLLVLILCAPGREEIDAREAFAWGIDTANALCQSKYGIQPFNPVVARVVGDDSSWVVRAGISPGDGNAYYARIETKLTGEPLASMVERMADSSDTDSHPEMGEVVYQPDSLVSSLHPAVQAGIPERYRYFMRRIYPPGPVMDSIVIRDDTCSYTAKTGDYTYIYRTTAPSAPLLDSIASLFGQVRAGSYIAPQQRRNIVSWLCNGQSQITCANCLFGHGNHVSVIRELERRIESVFWDDTTLTYEIVGDEDEES